MKFQSVFSAGVICGILFFSSSSFTAPARAARSESELPNCKLEASIENANLFACDSLHVLVAKGTPEERAHAHGKLIGSGLSPEPFHYFADLFGRAFPEHSFSRWAIETGQSLWAKWFSRGASADYRSEIAAFAKGAKVDESRVHRAMLFPDFGMFLWSMLDAEVSRKGLMGCTSIAKAVVANPAKSQAGSFVYGRNLDFFGSGIYDAHPLMIVSFPKEGSTELAHVGMATDGMLYAGVTGFNEKGIVLAVHQNYSKDAVLRGTPLIFVGELVLRQATTIGQALEIVKANRPSAQWTFVISDLKTGQTVAAETSSQQFEVRHLENGIFVQTNHSMSENTKKNQSIDVGTYYNSVLRMEKAKELLAKIDSSEKTSARSSRASSLTAIAQILTYQKNAEGELSAHEDILKSMTIQTVMVEKINMSSPLDSATVSVSVDLAPSSSGRFVTWGMGEIWKLKTEKDLKLNIKNFSQTTPEIRRKQRVFAEASAALEDGTHYSKALDLMSTQKSPASVFARAIWHHHLKQYAEAVKILQDLKSSGSLAKEYKYFQQAVDWLEIVCLSEIEKTDVVKARAKQIQMADILDPHYAEIVKFLSEGRSLKDRQKEFNYDFFSGYFSFRALTPEDIERLPRLER